MFYSALWFRIRQSQCILDRVKYESYLVVNSSNYDPNSPADDLVRSVSSWDEYNRSAIAANEVVAALASLSDHDLGSCVG